MKEFECLQPVAATIKSGAVVKCRHGEYKISGIVARYDKTNGWYYQLELQDLNASCVIYTSPQCVSIPKP